MSTQKEQETKPIFTSKEGVPLTEENVKNKRFVAFKGDDGKKYFGKIISVDPETKTATVNVKLTGKFVRNFLRGYRMDKTQIDANDIVGVGKTPDEALKWQDEEFVKKVNAAFTKMNDEVYGAKTSQELKKKLAGWENAAAKSPGTYIALAYERFAEGVEGGNYKMAQDKVKDLEEQEKKQKK